MKDAWVILQKTVRQWQEGRSLILAAALAFYIAISLAPLVTISLALASAVYGEKALQGQLVWQVTNYVGPMGAEVIQDIIANTSKRRWGLAPFFSFCTLLLGASATFVQLQRALNAVWHVEPRPDRPWRYTVRARLLAIALVAGTGASLVIFTAGGAVLSAIAGYISHFSPKGTEIWWQSMNFVVGVITFTGIFAALLKFLPDAVIRWMDVWAGALFTSVLFNAGRLIIGLYIGKWAPGSAYGTVGSVVAVLVWLYFSALILLLGAEFTQVYAEYRGVRIRPSAHAQKVRLVSIPAPDNDTEQDKVPRSQDGT